MLLRAIFLAIVLIFSANVLNAQTSPIFLRTTGGSIGAKTDVILLAKRDSVSFSGEVRLEGRIAISNPTVFYPQEWIQGKSSFLGERALTRLNDSLYSFAISIRCPSGNCDTLAHLRGEILAASDSLTALRLINLRLTDSRGSRSVPSTSGILTIQSIGTPLPIIRIPQLALNAPNPVLRGSSTTWAYRIDEPSDVTFSIFNALGQEIARLESKNQPRGANMQVWEPHPSLASGVYYVRFSSSTGEIWQRCILY